MKKILSTLVVLISCMCLWVTHAATTTNCDFDPNDPSTQINNALNDCFENRDDTKLVTAGDVNSLDNLDISDWFKQRIESWIWTLWSILAILAVASIVYGSFLLVISGWEEEKLKKWKDVVKWWILWFLWVVFAGALITIVVNIMFSI